MIDKEKVLEFIQKNGPVLPRDIVKKFGGDTFITGAVLSQLVDSKQLKISHAKIGGSPVYYSGSQSGSLKNLYKYLQGKEKEAFDLLNGKKILRDTNLEPAIRVALRNIKDFAMPLEVHISNTKEIFWKWYELQNNDAETIIREMLKLSLPKKEEEIKENSMQKLPQDSLKQEVLETQVPLKGDEKKSTHASGLLLTLRNLFSEKRIDILETNIIRKDSEIEMIINIPTPVGKLKYYCSARDKKKSNDKDLSSAFVTGNMKKLPVLYVTTGDLTKKAKEMLEKEFKIISVMKL